MATKKATAEKSSDSTQSVYLFTGEADSRRDAEVKKLIAQFINPDFEAFDLEKFDGDIANAEQILSAVATVPFGSARKVVIVDRVDRLNADNQSRIAAFIPKLGAQSCLVLLSGSTTSKQKSAASSKGKESDDEESTDGKKTKGARSDIPSAVKKHGTVVTFAKLKAQALSTMAMDLAKLHGKKIEPSAAQALSRSSEMSPALLEREIEKLAIYTDGRNTITMADVEKVSTRSPEDRVFPLIDAVAAGRSETAVELLSETLSAAIKPDNEVLKIVALLARQFRMLYQVKYLTSKGVRRLDSTPDELRAMLPIEQNPLSMGDWQRDKLVDQARSFTSEELEHCLKQILSCELSVKGIGDEAGSPRLLLEMLVFRLSHRRKQSH